MAHILDRLALWHEKKEAWVKAHPRYIPTPVAYLVSFRENGGEGTPPDWDEYKANQSAVYLELVEEFKAVYGESPAFGGNLVDIF